MSPVRIPTATYRLQFHAGFRFTDALALVPHLDTLGVSDIYASPIFCARRGSTHGYDVTDHTRLNPEIGSEEEFTALTDALRGRGMGLVMDIVPNHMGIADESNRWWQDVLENGPSSPHAMCFDIDWHPPKEDLVNKVLLPVLGDQFGRVLENQELQLVYEDETLRIAYHEKRFPVAPRSWIPILNLTIERAQGGAEAGSQLLELESIVTALGHLPPRTEHDPERIKERLREKEIIRRRLSALLEATATVREAFDAVIRQINGERGSPRSFDVLEGILGDQAYRLSFWRVAAEEINYRRFFDVSDLAAIRVERPEVFEEVHGLAFRLVREGRITGLRIDHPDGLFDPIQYFGDVQRGCRIGLSERGSLEAPGDSSESDERPFWVAVEKILTGEERLSAEWLVHGTTGYDFLNLVNGLFVDPDGARHLRTLWTRFTGLTVNFADLACECRKLILEVAMAGELHVLARRLDRISEQHRWSRDFTFYSLHDALTEVIACFPVYRTYVRTSTTSVGEEDRRHIETAIRSAKRRNPAMSASLFDFIARVLLLEDPEGLSDEERSERREFVMRFQQFTGPVMAKGLEDTTFYRWHPLASLNEVGGQPARIGVSVDEFHRHGAERRRDWPHSLLATSTHDTKRSEDVRARLNVLSEIPGEWGQAIRRWRRANRKRRTRAEGLESPDANEEYLLYQTLVGAWPLRAEEVPLFRDRVRSYMVKATREAKVHTSWISPNEEHERALLGFIDALFDFQASEEFWTDFHLLSERIAWVGAMNSLAQTLLKITAPGVPDFYQGTELWDFSLVDPDNRRPVNFAERTAVLEELRQRAAGDLGTLIRELLTGWRDGRVKMWVTHRALTCRREHRELFQEGEYIPLPAQGVGQRRVVAFARRLGDQWAVTAAPRLAASLSPPGIFPLGERAWSDTSIPLPGEAPMEWRNVLTGEVTSVVPGAGSESSLRVADLFTTFPLALLEPMAPPEPSGP